MFEWRLSPLLCRCWPNAFYGLSNFADNSSLGREKLIKIFWNQIDQLNARLIEHCNLLKMFDVNGKKSIYRWWIENWISASPQNCSHGSNCFAVRHSPLCSCWPEIFIGFKYNVSVFHTILASLLLLLGICVLILCLKFLCAFILPGQRVESAVGFVRKLRILRSLIRTCFAAFQILVLFFFLLLRALFEVSLTELAALDLHDSHTLIKTSKAKPCLVADKRIFAVGCRVVCERSCQRESE